MRLSKKDVCRGPVHITFEGGESKCSADHIHLSRLVEAREALKKKLELEFKNKPLIYLDTIQECIDDFLLGGEQK